MQEVISRRAPDFSLPILGGGRLSLSELRGSIVVLNFWSAECPWSRRADVLLVYRQLTWGRKGVRIVGIASNANEPEAEIQYEIEHRHVKYPILLDQDQKIAGLYKAETTPHFFVLDRQGALAYTGAMDDATYKQRRPKNIFLDQAIEALLENRAPNPTVTPPYGCAIVRPGGEAGAAVQKSDR